MKRLIFILLLCFVLVTGCKEAKLNTDIKSIAVNDIVINQSHAYVNKGEQVVLIAQVFPFNADNQTIEWRTDNKNIAVVDKGIVTGVGEGKTVISAISEDGGFEAKCELYVSYPKLDYNNTPNYSIGKKVNIQNFNNSMEKTNNSTFDNLQNELNNLNNVLLNNIYFYEPHFYLFETIFGEIDALNNFVKNNNLIKNKIEEYKSEDVDRDENKGNKTYVYEYEYKYNSNGINEEDIVGDDITYSDNYQVKKERFYTF